MGYGGQHSAFSNVEINGLVDGKLDSARQAEVVKRLKSHDVERIRVAAWREQNELLKASFSAVENEPIPFSLSLTPPPRLMCVTSDSQSDASPTLASIVPAVSARSSKRTRRVIFGFGTLIACVGIAGGGLLTPHAASIEPRPGLKADGAAPNLRTPDSASPYKIDSSQDKPRLALRDLPTTVIPTLDTSGFSFIGATLQATNPPTMVFSYEDAAADHIVLSVAKAPASNRLDTSPPKPDDHVVTWRRHGAVYTLGGTPNVQRLDLIAAVLIAQEDAADTPE